MADPVFEDWECPPGWTPRAVEQGRPWAHSICEVASPPDCEGSQYALPGGAVCRPLGRACDEAFSLEGTVIYVDASAGPGGDGGRQTPLNDLAAALALPAATDGATIRLAPGEYPGEVSVERSVSLRGACTSGVVVGPIRVAAEGPVLLDNLSVRPGAPSVAVADTARSVTMSDLLIEGATDYAVRGDQRGGTLALERVVVRDTVTDNPVALGNSLFLRSAAAATVRDSVLEDCAGACVFAGAHDEAGVGSLSIAGSVVRRVLSTPEQHPELVRLYDGVGGNIERSLFEHAGDKAIILGQSGGGSPPVVTVTDCAVRDIGEQDGAFAVGIGMAHASRMILRRTVFDRIAGVAVGVGGAPAGLAGLPSADLTDIVVRDSQIYAAIAGGLLLDDGGSIVVRRGLFQRTGAVTLSVRSDEPGLARMEVEDVVISDAVGALVDEVQDWLGVGRTRILTTFAAGVHVGSGDFVGRRLAVLGQPRGSIAIQGAQERPATLDLEDLQVADLQPVSIEFPELESPPLDSVPPQGLSITGEAQVEVRRMRATGFPGQIAFAVGHPVLGRPVARLTDVHGEELLETQDRRTGLALGAALGAELSLVRTTVRNSAVMAVTSFGWPFEPQTNIRIEHLLLDGVVGASCGQLEIGAEGSCVTEAGTEAGGLGLLVREGGWLTAADFEVRGAELAGAISASGGRLELHRGVLTHNAIGLNVMHDEQDLGLLEDQVYVFDNGVDVARQQLLLPSLPGLPTEGDDPD